ncbi:LPS export ABC transporter periplasmic protein LptC [Rapidithrix thailandica]|uniref:LPS export ABC transporter periplasmic protein LptC n=1 Tax=Rapidithrix thailandica TaxID=413964 RepID=A0AAW9RT07_9BACT
MSRFLYFVLFGSLCFSIGACKKTKFADPHKQTQENTPISVYSNSTIYYSKDALLTAKIQAETRMDYENNDQKFPDGIFIEMFDEQGKLKTTLKADSAIHNYKEQRYQAIGNVIVNNVQEQNELKTVELNWDKKTRKIYTDSAVVITTPQNILKGIGLVSDQEFKHPTILEPTGTISLSENN